jgi:predicted 2-oxoglutarate/Fe(II)-dependent dioxygenase YbiX
MKSIQVFERIIPPSACRQIIREGITRPQISAGIGKNNTASKGRSTKVTFINNAFVKSYIYELVTHNFKNYIIKEAEDLQFATYTKGDFYGLHKDANETNSRILSVTVQLSKSSEYKGGNLVFNNYPVRNLMERRQGTVIIFPSNLYHEVEPVIKGKRYSLVQWFKGYESSTK